MAVRPERCFCTLLLSHSSIEGATVQDREVREDASLSIMDGILSVAHVIGKALEKDFKYE